MRTLVALAAVCTLATACGDERPGRAPFPGGAGARVAAAHTDVPLGTAVTWSVLQDDDEQAAAVGRAFDSITPENEMKWEVVEPRRGRFAFGDADALVGWARAHGKRVRGHTLVWHQQAPAWLGAEDWSAAEAERILVEHVRAVAGHFRGKVDSWDVVNEPFTDDGGWRSDENFPFLDKLGPRYVEVALRAARQADPGARLVINEIGAESGGPKLAALVKLARDLRGRGVPLDAIGLESHHEVGKAPSRARVRATMRALAATGVDVEVTELDVADPSGDARAQAAAYADTAAACAAVRACRRLTIWGVSDRDSWLGADRRALPFDTELRPKPAWDALVTALKR